MRNDVKRAAGWKRWPLLGTGCDQGSETPTDGGTSGGFDLDAIAVVNGE